MGPHIARLGLGVIALPLLSILALPSSVRAAVSAQSGPWSDTATWGGAVPGPTDDATIASGHQVTVDITTATASTTTIHGVLSFSRIVSSSFTLVQGSMTVAPGGLLDMGTDASPIPSTVSAHLVLGYGAGSTRYGLVIRDGGNFSVRGSTKVPATTLSASILGAGSTLNVSDDPAAMGWRAGDSITISPGEGSHTAVLRTITGISGNQLTVNSPFSTIHFSTWTVYVVNTSRNALVRSSGTSTLDALGNTSYILNLARNTTSFSVAYGEFAYLGRDLSGQYGLTFDGAQGQISSSTIRNGFKGLHLLNSSTNTFAGNLIAFNADAAVVLEASHGNSFLSDHAFENVREGFLLTFSDRNRFDRARIWENAYVGMSFYAASRNTVTNCSLFDNNSGFFFGPSAAENLVASCRVYGNAAGGITVQDSSDQSSFIDTFVYDNNGHSLRIDASGGLQWAGGGLGYSPGGELMPNLSEIEMATSLGGPDQVLLKGARLAAGDPIGLDIAGAHVRSYNQDSDTGTLRIWGNYQLSGATLTLDNASALYPSTYTSVKLMRGEGHAIVSLDTFDAAALSEVISVTALGGGSWRIEGSSSGVLDPAFSCPAGSCAFTHAKLSFTLNPGATISIGDRLDFATFAASGDAGVRKKLLFGPGGAYTSGRSKLEVAAGAGLVLKGALGSHVLIDMLPGGTFYTLVSSGAFSAQYSSFSNVDSGGLQLSGSRGVSLSSATFDFMGFTRATSAYITARGLTSNLTLAGMTFGVSNSTAGQPSAYNVRIEGADSGLSWSFTGAQGALAGESYDDDPNSKVLWLSPQDVFSFSTVHQTSVTATIAASGATSYSLIASTASNMTGTIFLSSTSDTSVTQLSVSGLARNTTYYFRFDGLGPGVSFSSAAVLATLAASPDPVSFSAISPSGFTANWSQNSNPSGTIYQIALSTDVNFGSFVSSETIAAFSRIYSSLAANTTFYFRARALSHGGVPTAYALGAVITAGGIITISANRLPSVWYNTVLTAFNAQGAVNYYYQVTATPNYSPTAGDPQFDGSSLLVTLPAGIVYFHVTGLNGGGTPIGTAHFGPLYIDIGSPSVPALSAQKSSLDPTPVLDGGTVFSQSPRFTWSVPSVGPSNAPIVGYSFAISTNAADVPPESVNTTLTFADHTFTTTGRYYPKVRALNLAGTWGAASGMTIDFTTIPSVDAIVIRKNYFNPTRGECVQAEIQAAASGRLRVQVFTPFGRLVSILADSNVPAGSYPLSWCGKNSAGEKVASGVYILHIEAPGEKRDVKVGLVK